MKKDEENILNKKKKREETKQKNQAEKARNINRPIQNDQNMFMTQMNNYPYMDYSKFNPYTSQLMFFYKNNPVSYYPSFGPVETKKESDNLIYSYMLNTIRKGIVNHIIGALYIFNIQQNKPKHLDKKVVPINTVIHENKIVDNKNIGDCSKNNNDVTYQNFTNINNNINNDEFFDELKKNNGNINNGENNDIKFNNNGDNNEKNNENNINEKKEVENNILENKKNSSENEDNKIDNNLINENQINEIEKNANQIEKNQQYRTIIS